MIIGIQDHQIQNTASKPGTQVRIHGLTGAVHLNNCHAEIQSWNDHKQRYAVRILETGNEVDTLASESLLTADNHAANESDSKEGSSAKVKKGEVKLIKAENLQTLDQTSGAENLEQKTTSDSILQKGTHVILQNLKSAAEMNGHLAQIESYDEAKARYAVSIPGIGVKKSVKRENFRVEDPHPDFICAISRWVPQDPVRVFGDLTLQLYDRQQLMTWLSTGKKTCPTDPSKTILSPQQQLAMEGDMVASLHNKGFYSGWSGRPLPFVHFPYREWLKTLQSGDDDLRKQAREEAKVGPAMDAMTGQVVTVRRSFPEEDVSASNSMDAPAAMVYMVDHAKQKIEVMIAGEVTLNVDWKRSKLLSEVFERIGKKVRVTASSVDYGGMSGVLSDFNSRKGTYEMQINDSDNAGNSGPPPSLLLGDEDFEVINSRLNSRGDQQREHEYKQKYILERLDKFKSLLAVDSNTRHVLPVWALFALTADLERFAVLKGKRDASMKLGQIRQQFQNYDGIVMSLAGKKTGSTAWNGVLRPVRQQLEAIFREELA